MYDLQIRGLAIMAAIALIVMLFALRRQPRAIWMFALALVAMGLGYLATTPAPAEFAELIFGPAAPAPAKTN
jgi:dipeptide/tripeptide permease